MDKGVVRQAIKEVETDKIVGYELRFQSGSGDFYGEAENAAADTISEFLMNNSHKIFRDKRIFITFTPSLLFRNLPRIFEKNKVIIQIEDNLIIHPLAMPIIQKYHAEGYQFAINDFQFSPKYFSVLEYADFIRIQVNEEISDRERHSLENIIRMTKGFGKKCIATGIDSRGAYDNALSLGVDFLEGNHIAKTLTTKANKVDYMQGNFFQLVVAVAKEEPDMAEIEAIVSRDAGLTYALLKLVNSAYFALRRRTASIRQALMTLGIGQLRQWVYMLSFHVDENFQEEDGTAELLKISFLRAKFAEELAPRIGGFPLAKSEAYMMEMFSTLELMVDAPMEEILTEIPLREEIRDALLKGEGMAGQLHQLILAYEQADWKQSKVLADKLGLQISTLSQIYINCVEDVNTIWDELTADFARPDEEKVFKSPEDSREHIEDALK